MTPAQMKAARHALGLTVEGLAAVIEVDGRTIRRWEDGSRSVPGPVRVLVRLMERSGAVRRELDVA